MLVQQGEARRELGRLALRALRLGCVAAFIALRLSAAPAAPGNLLATPGNAKVTVTWNAVTGATSYNVYRSLTRGGPYGSPLATGLTATSYTDSAVTNNTTYYYVATAVDGTGEGARSAEDPATPRAGTFVSGLIGGTSGPITTTWTTAGSPYVVVGDVEVRGNVNTGNNFTSTLVVQPGVQVLFEPGTGLFIGDDTGTVSGHSGRLLATGATFTSNRTAPSAGDWKGIRFGDTATDGGANNFLDGCTLTWAGGGGALAAVVVNLSSPEIRNGTAIRGTVSGGIHVIGGGVSVSGSEIEGGSAPAIRLLGSSSLSLLGTTLRSGTYPVQMQPNVVLSALSGNTASGYPLERNGIAIEGGLMGGTFQSRTWPGGDLPYIVLGDLTVRGNVNTSNDHTSTLVIGGGNPAEVRFNSGVELFIGDDSGTIRGHSGRLQATKVTFKGNAATPTPGFWKGIYFGNTVIGGGDTFLDACTVESAGGTDALAAVAVNGISLVLRNGTAIRNPGNVGLYLTASGSSSATVTGVEIEGGSGPAVQALGFSSLALTGVTLSRGTYPVQMQPNVVLSALNGNTASGYPSERNGIAVEGGLMGGTFQSRTWPGGDLPYIVLGDLTVRGNVNTSNDHSSTLVIGGGTPAEVRFNSGVELFVGDDTGTIRGHSGRLQATGVTFKANSAAPAPGFWKGIYFGNTVIGGETFLDACAVEDAGGTGALAAVAVNGISLVLRNGTAIRNPGNVGLYLTASGSSSATVTGGGIEGGSGPAVQALGFSSLALTSVTLSGGTYPVQMQPNVVLSALSGNTASGYPLERNGIAVEGGLMGGTFQSRTWPGGDLPYVVLADLTVRGNVNTSNDHSSTLVIGGGKAAEVRFNSGVELFVGDDTGTIRGHSGRLQATGVTFKANSAAPAPGFWKGIYFGNTVIGGGETFLDACAVEDAGGTGALAAVAVNGISLVLRNGTAIRNPDNVGLYLTASGSSSATVTGGEIEGGSGPAVQALGFSSLALTSVTLRGGTYPVQMQPNVVLSALSGNTASGYPLERNGIAIEGGLMGGTFQSRTWPGGDLPYIVLGDLTVRGNVNNSYDHTSTLVIGGGNPAEVRFNSGVELFVGDDTGTIRGHSGRLQAAATTFKANTATPAPGFWKGIYFGNTVIGGGETFLDACTVESAGGTGALAAVAVNGISLVLRNGTAIRNPGNVGLYLTASGSSSATVTGGEIEGGSGPAVQALGFSSLALTSVTLSGGTYPVQMQPNVVLSALSNNTASGYPLERNGIAVEGGLMGGTFQSRTWPGGDLPYIVLGDLTVRGNVNNSYDHTSTLVIGSPTEVRFSSGAGLFIGDDSGTAGGHWGRLQATGVTFTADTTTPSPGFWKGIYFGDQARDGDTVLDHSIVDWAGGGVPGAVRVNASAPVLKDTAIRDTATAGVYLTSSSASQLSVLGGEVEGGSDAAVKALGFSTLVLRDAALRGGTYPVRMSPNTVLAALAGNRLEGYPFERAGVAVEGGLMGGTFQSRSWPGGDLPYVVLGDVTVRGNVNNSVDHTSTLALQSGGEVRFEGGASLQVGDDSGTAGGHWGVLQASGVTFTANSSSPAPDFWKGIYFADQSRDDLSLLFDSRVEYGGNFGESPLPGSNVSSNRSAPYLSGVVVRGSSRDGVVGNVSDAVLSGARLLENSHGVRLLSSGSLSIADSDIERNSLFGAINGASTLLVARFNWWGDPSGPQDPLSNPGGRGDRVSDKVDYASWLTASAQLPVLAVGLTVQPGNGTADLVWSANPERDVTGYNVYRRQPPATAWTLRNPSPVPASTSPSFHDAGLSNRIEHCYQVRAVDSQGREGDPSREACATPKVDVTPPAWTGPPGALFAEGGDGSAIVRFEPATDEVSTPAYNVYYSTVSPINRSLSGTGRILNAAVTPSGAGYALEVSVPGLINGRRYSFNVQAVDAEGNEDGNAVEVTAVIGAGSGTVIAASPWTGATLDGVEVDGQGSVVLTAGRTEGQITSAVLELPAGADLSAVAWNAVQPAGTSIDTVPGGALTIEVRAADDAANLANARCIAPTGVTAWWPGEGNGADVQAGRDSAVQGGTRFAAGRSGSAFRMDGVNDYVEPSVDVSETAYTLSLWFKTACDACGLFSVDDGSLGSNGNDRHLFLSGGRLCARVWSNETICTAESGYADDQWHHAVHVFGGSVGGQKIFVDGVQRAAGSKSLSDFTWQTGVNLGFSNDAASGFFAGLLDEVIVFNRALSPAEIQALYAAGGSGLCKPDADGDGVANLFDVCPATPARTAVNAAGCPAGCFGPPANRVSWWRGEGNAADSSGANAGTLANGAGFDAGQVGQAFRFDGVDDRFEVANFGSFTQLTVQAWVYREGVTSRRESLVSYKEGDSPNCGFLLALNEYGDRELPWMYVKVNGTWQSAAGGLPVPFERWTHLAGTYDGQVIRLYVNGVLAAATSAAGSMTQCTQKMALGARASVNPAYPYFFPGRLDEVVIFDRALSPREIQALAAAGSAGMCATAPPPPGGPAGTPQVEQGWVQVAPNQILDLPDGRYVQFRATLRGDGARSPSLRSVSLGYRGPPGGGG